MSAQLTPNERKLVEDHEHIARMLAAGYARSTGFDRDELVSAAYEGLIDAARRFRFMGTPFGAYCWQRVAGAIIDHIRAEGPFSRAGVPRELRRARSLDQAVDGSTLLELLRSGEPPVADVADHVGSAERVEQFLGGLSARQRRAVRLTLAGLTEKEIGVDLGVSESRVSQIMGDVKRMCVRDATPGTITLAPAERPSHGLSGLSFREMTVLSMGAQGLNAKETATALYVTENTIRTHRKHILQKLGARNIAHAVALAFGLGYLQVKEAA